MIQTESLAAAADKATEAHVLIVDDEPELSESIAWRLESAGYSVTAVGNGIDALAVIAEEQPDVILLDLFIPGMNGLDVLRELRQNKHRVPVILISGRSDETDRVVALEMGADDFVVKPFSPRELVARIRSVLRRANASPISGPAEIIEVADIVIDPASRRVVVRGKEVALAAKELGLLVTLASQPDRTFTKHELFEAVWGDATVSKPEATLAEHMSRLRQKVEASPGQPQRLITVRGLGYRLRS